MPARDLTNLQFGRLTARYLHPSSRPKKRMWYCECECGGRTGAPGWKIVSQRSLLLGMAKSCNCLLKEDRPGRRKEKTLPDLSGQIVNQWRVISPDPNDPKRHICECMCAAHTRESVSTARLVSKRARWCRLCSSAARRGPRPELWDHGYASEYATLQQQLTYTSWQAMVYRVKSGSHPLADNTPADMDPVFEDIGQFVAAVGLRPSREHSIERIDNTRGYWPGNVVWETKKQQAVNRASTVFIDVWGSKLSKTDWQEQLGLTRREFESLLASHPQRSDLTQLVLNSAAHLVLEPITTEQMHQIDEFVDELMQMADASLPPTEEI